MYSVYVPAYWTDEFKDPRMVGPHFKTEMGAEGWLAEQVFEREQDENLAPVVDTEISRVCFKSPMEKMHEADMEAEGVVA